MSYQTIKDMIVDRLESEGLTESKEDADFENASISEFGNTFIINTPEGERNEDNDSLMDRYRENQQWNIQIAFSKSQHNHNIIKDEAHKKREDITKDLDNPDNWKASAFYMRYEGFTMESLDNYFLLTLTLSVIDQNTY